VVDEPCNVAEVFVQLMLALVAATLALGTVVLVLTVIVVLAEHPLFGSVTVSVYTPAALTVPLAALFGVTPALQLYVTPVVVEDPLTVAFALLQSIVWLAPALMFGRLLSGVTTAVAVALHPLLGSVTVSV
jgi:hypothetical protein